MAELSELCGGGDARLVVVARAQYQQKKAEEADISYKTAARLRNNHGLESSRHDQIYDGSRGVLDGNR